MKKILFCLMAFLGLCTYQAKAQWAVIDPSNLAQNILTVSKTATTATNVINSFKEMQKIYDQGKEYYDKLQSVNNLIKDARKVKETVAMVSEIAQIYSTNFYKSWLKMNDKGASTGVMDWDEAPPIDYREMNIISALPSNIKVNDWIENFCKAFNLSLTNPRGNEFKLDLKKTRLAGATSSIIDLDNKANVNLRTNQPLGLPYRYNIGFTIDTDEEGYMKFDANDEPIIGTEETGGGVFYTGSYETSEIDQSSIFSYCWYKEIFNNINGGSFEAPVITDHEIWTNQPDYEEMLDKFYSDKSQRFWFKDSTMAVRLNDKVDVDIATVKNYMTVGNKRLALDYKDQDGSIMRNFFFITTNEKNYTVIDCYLSPDEYNKLPYSLIKFNGDLYNAAEIDGYDPTGKKQGTIKLIKRLR